MVTAATSTQISNEISTERKAMFLVLLILAQMYIVVMFFVTMVARNKAFNRDFMAGFDSLHAAEVGGGQAV